MPPQQPAEQERVSPLIWGTLFVAIICDLAKIALFALAFLPVIGTALSFGFSFYISVIEVTVVFGGLWMMGVYKSQKDLLFNLLTTFGVVTVDLVPLADDFPFTSPIVFWIIVKAYARKSKLTSLATTAAVSAATGGVGGLAERKIAANIARATARREARLKKEREEEPAGGLPEPT